jgi:hypothetical protein
MATALIAMLVATSSAGAASFSTGTVKLDFKLKSAKQTNKGGTSAKNTFPFAENAGEATMNSQASGNLNIGSKNTSVTLKRGSKTIVLQSMVQKLKSGKGVLAAKVKGKGKLIDFFDQASTNRISANSTFSQLTMSSSKMTLTKAGAAAINKALGLKAPARGKPDLRYKAKAAAGSASFTANRSLTITGGDTRTVYDQKFVNDLRACNIELSAVDPATSIPKGGDAPEGGVILPINSAAGGTLNAQTLVGQVNHLGGTRLSRPGPGQPGNTTGKAAYDSPLNNFVFGLQGGALHTLTATIVNANNLSTNIGSVTGTPAATLTDGPGSVALTGELLLSEAASGTLSQNAPPLGADCPIPAGSKIGSIVMDARVG